MSLRIAIVDSGIFAEHPLVGPIAGGIAIAGEDLMDHLGHGTAVAATIRRHAPTADLYVVKIFDRSLACPIATLVRALDWSIENRMDVVNLSLGTTNQDHVAVLRDAVERASAAGARIVAPAGCLPGDLEGVIAVDGTASAGSIAGPSFAVPLRTAQFAAP